MTRRVRRSPFHGLPTLVVLALAAVACRPGDRRGEPAAEAPAAPRASVWPASSAEPSPRDPSASEPDPTAPAVAGAGLCGDLAAPLAQALGLAATDLRLRPADVRDIEFGTTLEGCRLSWSGPGTRLAFGQSARDLPAYRAQTALQAIGWEEQVAQRRILPGDSRKAFTKGANFCYFDVAFRPPEGLPCPSGEPVTCGLGPRDLDYTVALSCAGE